MREDNNREIGTGQYTFTGGMERLCKCGHSLGVHCATRIKTETGMIQDCMNHDVGDGKVCDCKCFKPKK